MADAAGASGAHDQLSSVSPAPATSDSTLDLSSWGAEFVNSVFNEHPTGGSTPFDDPIAFRPSALTPYSSDFKVQFMTVLTNLTFEECILLVLVVVPLLSLLYRRICGSNQGDVRLRDSALAYLSLL